MSLKTILASEGLIRISGRDDVIALIVYQDHGMRGTPWVVKEKRGTVRHSMSGRVLEVARGASSLPKAIVSALGNSTMHQPWALEATAPPQDVISRIMNTSGATIVLWYSPLTGRYKVDTW